MTFGVRSEMKERIILQQVSRFLFSYCHTDTVTQLLS